MTDDLVVRKSAHDVAEQAEWEFALHTLADRRASSPRQSINDTYVPALRRTIRYLADVGVKQYDDL